MSFVISLLVYFSNEYANVFSTFTLVVFNQDLCKSPKLGIWAFLCFCSLNDNPLHILIIASLQSTCSLWRVTNSRFCRWYFFIVLHGYVLILVDYTKVPEYVYFIFSTYIVNDVLFPCIDPARIGMSKDPVSSYLMQISFIKEIFVSCFQVLFVFS